MNSKIFCAFFAIFTILQRSSVESLDLRILTNENIFSNQRIASYVPHEVGKLTTTTSCGGTLTQAPGKIEQHFELGERTNVKCTWKIHAPRDHSVYIRSVMVGLTTLPGKPLGDQTDSVDLQIYEGNNQSIAKRLYNFKTDTSLNKCISNGKSMTVVLNYQESGLHAEHDISIKYGFVKRSQISDLLN